jgi:formate hydrogenlyase transcriptional activator
MGDTGIKAVNPTRHGWGFFFRQNKLRIRTRLTASFLIIVLSMIVADALVFWQFTQMVAPSRRLSSVDQVSLALIRVHLDVDALRENVAALESTHDTRQFSTEAAQFRQNFLHDVEEAQQMLSRTPEIAREDPTMGAALETLKVAPPAQLDTAVQLADAGDWTAVRLRLNGQIQDLLNLSASLVTKVDRRTEQLRTGAVAEAETAQQRLFVVVPIAALLTLIVAAALGWYTTRSITSPLAELATGAQALARGDFEHEVHVSGNDELAFVGRAFNHAVRQLQELYEELREQASLLSLAHDAIYVRDMKGVIRYWNRGAEELYGWPAECAVGEVAHELLKTVYPLPFEQIETELLRTGRWQGELVKTKKDGTQVVVASRCSLKRDDRGAPVATLVTSNDITARKHAEEEMREGETRFRTFVDHAGDALFVQDFEQGTIVDVNRQACESLGYTRQELIGNTVLALHLDPDRAGLEPVAESAAAGGTVVNTHWHRRKDGSVFPVEAHTTLVWYAGRRFLLNVVRDITDRLRAEEAVRQGERQLRDVIETMPAIVWSTLPDGSVEFINRRWQEFTGLGGEGALGWNWEALVHPDDRARFVGDWRAALTAGQPTESEVRVRAANGEYRWLLVRNVPLRDEQGNIVRWYGTATDIEHRKRAEERLQHENVALRVEIEKASMFEEVVGASPALRSVLSAVSKVAPTDSTVLLTGETGTGKELIARAVHKKSPRGARAFVAVNCAAIPQSLIASELFGHEKGAFTGALQRRLGSFELAEGGTIFLDEIGELPLETQIALLRVLQEREIQRVGASQPIHVNVRVLAATNRDLQKAIAAAAFRQDLFYRLDVFPIHVPPLRERKEDIPVLVEYFVDRFAKKAGKNIRSIEKRALELLESYSWPGNIRELQNVIERAVIVCETEALTIDGSWLSLGNSYPQGPARSASLSLGKKSPEQEKELIERALTETEGRISGPSGAAAKLGIPASTLEYKIRLLRINKHQFKEYLRES